MSRIAPRLHKHIAESLPALRGRGGVGAGVMWLVHWLGGLGGGARTTDGGLVVGENVLETHVRVGHAEVGVLGIENLDELGGSVAHDGRCERTRIKRVWTPSSGTESDGGVVIY